MSASRSAPARYDLVSVLLHWAMALLILVLFLLGWYMVDLPKGSPERTYFFTLHKSTGLTVATLLVLRVVWRLCHPGPEPARDLAEWQRRLSVATHRLLYAFMFLQPLSGYLSSSFSGYATRFWGIALPRWTEEHSALNQLFTDVHELSSMVLLALIGLHLAGALAHLWTGHESVLPRMLPGLPAPPGDGAPRAVRDTLRQE